MKEPKILLVEDDERFGELQRDFLVDKGFTVRWLRDGLNIAEEIESFDPELIVLDLMLPGTTGLDICRNIRASFKGSIIFLTSSDDDFDHVACLELGADDFLSKPIQPRVLLARIRMLTRRIGSMSVSPELKTALRYGTLQLKRAARDVNLDGARIELTGSEFELLWVLATHPDKVLSRSYLFQVLRGIEFDGMDRSVDTKIVSLRRKLRDTEGTPRRIVTIRNKGYLFSSGSWE